MLLLGRELSAPAASTSSHMGRVNQPSVRAGDSAQPVTNNDRVRQAMREDIHLLYLWLFPNVKEACSTAALLRTLCHRTPLVI